MFYLITILPSRSLPFSLTFSDPFSLSLSLPLPPQWAVLCQVGLSPACSCNPSAFSGFLTVSTHRGYLRHCSLIVERVQGAASLTLSLNADTHVDTPLQSSHGVVADGTSLRHRGHKQFQYSNTHTHTLAYNHIDTHSHTQADYLVEYE